MARNSVYTCTCAFEISQCFSYTIPFCLNEVLVLRPSYIRCRRRRERAQSVYNVEIRCGTRWDMSCYAWLR